MSLNSVESRKHQQRRFDAQNQAAAAKIKASLGVYKAETEQDMMDRLMPTRVDSASSYKSVSISTKARLPSKQPSSILASSSSSSANYPNENGSLITSMASRLSTLEKSHRKLRSELVAKDREVLSWKAKYEALVRATQEEGLTAAEEIMGLDRANAQLRKQVHEMESFLQDYGLVWVGQGSEQATDEVSAATIGSRIDFGLLFTRFKELNALAGEGRPKIHTDGRAARFDFGDKIPLTVYRDGIFIKRGPFRPYSDHETQRFVSDVLDGYFPPEFKEEHPDGIIFDVKDYSKTTYEEARNGSRNSSAAADSNFRAFSGQGQKIGSTDQMKPMSRDEFLSRLPERSISKGRVVSIRDEISSKLSSSWGQEEKSNLGNQHIIGSAAPHSLSMIGGGDIQLESIPESLSPNDQLSVTLAETPALSMLKESATRGELSVDRDVTTLRIKLPGNGASLIAKMYFDDTVGDLRKHVAKHVNSTEFDIKAAFPTRTFDDDSVSLRDAGLVPNAKMHISIPTRK